VREWREFGRYEEMMNANMIHRLEKRRQAMLDMPQMIQTWKEVWLPSSSPLS